MSWDTYRLILEFEGIQIEFQDLTNRYELKLTTKQEFKQWYADNHSFLKGIKQHWWAYMYTWGVRNKILTKKEYKSFIS